MRMTTRRAYVIIALLAALLVIGLYTTLKAAPVEQTFPGAGILGETNLEFGFVLYIRQLNDSEERTVMVTRSLGGGASAQCKFNSSNAQGNLVLSNAIQLPNGDIAYDLYLNRTAGQGVQSFAEQAQELLENPDTQQFLESLGNLDLSDFRVDDIQGSIVIPNTEDISIPPSIVC